MISSSGQPSTLRARGDQLSTRRFALIRTTARSGSTARISQAEEDDARDELRRGVLAASFVRTAFSLDIDEIALCLYDEKDAPGGFHVIKRSK